MWMAICMFCISACACALRALFARAARLGIATAATIASGARIPVGLDTETVSPFSSEVMKRAALRR